MVKSLLNSNINSMITCLNCGQSFRGNYCPNCGQKATVKRLTFLALIEDILHFFTHLEKGFLFTSWNFIVRPGITSMNYIKGRRKKYQGSTSYFLIWTGLYILVHNSIINHYHYQFLSADITQLNLQEQANLSLRTHFSLFIIPILLISALFIFLILGKPQYNFIEILTLCLYGGGTYFMMLLVSDLILGIVFKVNTISTNVFLWQTILSSVYNFWFSYDIFKRAPIKLFWLRLVAVSILVATSGWFLLLYLPMAWVYLAE